MVYGRKNAKMHARKKGKTLAVRQKKRVAKVIKKKKVKVARQVKRATQKDSKMDLGDGGQPDPSATMSDETPTAPAPQQTQPLKKIGTPKKKVTSVPQVKLAVAAPKRVTRASAATKKK